MARRIVVGSDHAGFELKEHIKGFLAELGYQVEDVGIHSQEPVDYPDYTQRAASRVASAEFERGILCCGTGLGTAIAANKLAGIRAVVCADPVTAALSRSHNDANILVLGGWLVGKGLAREIVHAWLTTPFDGGRHQHRLNKITAIETGQRLKRGRLYEVSLPIHSGMLLWPDSPRVSLEPVKEIARGGSSNVSRLSLGTHTGTHIDAPGHFIEGGPGVDAIVPERLLGRARLFHLPQVRCLDREDLEGLRLEGVCRVLFRTRNSSLLREKDFTPDYAYLTEGGRNTW